MKRTAWIGRVAQARVRGNGPRAKGRPAASVTQWKTIRAAVLARAGWRCQACGRGGRLDVHHLIKRAQGGSDFDLDQLVAVCRRCHEQTDAPYGRRRLLVVGLGAGRFHFQVVENDCVPR
jgi:5-methylcytosine-specific restriction endonuclease McrA